MTNRINNKISLVVFLIALMSAGFVSCHKSWHKCDSFITCYTQCKSLAVAQDVYDNESILIHSANTLPILYYHLNSRGEEKRIYESLCSKHDDSGYNGYEMIKSGLEDQSRNYIDRDFSSIEIYSDRDFDASHPSGSNLSDIVRFLSVSPYRYIKSQYREYYHYDEKVLLESFRRLTHNYLFEDFFDPSVDNTVFPIDKLVNELKREDLTLLGTGELGFVALLNFEKKPEVPGEYRLNVNVIADDGEVFRNTVTMKF